MTWSGKQWSVRPKAPTWFVDQLGTVVPSATVLWNRGHRTFESASAFLTTEYPAGLHDPSLMHGMIAAVDRISQAISQGEKIAIYGDFDTDGVTAAVLMRQVLTLLGATTQVYIPHREREGYGLHNSMVQAMLDDGVQLLVTVDCGISNIDEVANARSVGIDVIVTDHHTPPEIVPDAILVNPKLPGDPYPFKGLVGCGLAFKLAGMLDTKRIVRGRDVLDLVGLATVADMGPLEDENRVLAKAGLRALRESRRPGIEALCSVAQIDQSEITAGDIGFMLAPRLNASGRLYHAQLSYQLLLTEDPAEAKDLAQKLNALNRERQEHTQRELERAEEWIRSQNLVRLPVLVVPLEDTVPGIVGLVAAKLVERYHRPAVVLNIHGDRATGSARSVEKISIVEGLRTAAPLLIKFGGHAMAAGLSIVPGQIPALEKALSIYCAQFDYTPTQLIDMELDLVEITSGLLDDLALFEPYGQNNPRPCFVSTVTILQPTVFGKGQQHLRFKAQQGAHIRDVVAWRMGPAAAQLRSHQQLHIVYTPEFNTFNGTTSIQLVLRDFALP